MSINTGTLLYEPDDNAFVVWYDPYGEPYAVYFRSDANAWDDQRWFNADQHHSGGTEPSAWGALRDELYGNDGPHLLVPRAAVDELTAELSDVRAKYQDALWTASQLGGKVTKLTAEVERLRAVVKAAIHYVNCPQDEAETGEPWSALVHAVRVHERQEVAS